MKAIVCELCGGNNLVKEDGYFVCQNCGTKYTLEEAKRLYGSVEVTVSTPVKIVNNEFESKFANAKNWELLYFSKGPNSVTYGQLKGYDAMLRYFSDAEKVGANESRYFVEYADFYVRANMEGFKTGYRVLKNRQEFINGYSRLMDLAIINATNDTEKRELEKKKEDGIGYLQRELPKAKQGCYVATSVYGSYDCPQVWTLRRYRDYRLAKTWYGRAFIKAYYAISPTIVKWFGETSWFRKLWKGVLDKKVSKLNNEGFENTPYDDSIY